MTTPDTPSDFVERAMRLAERMMRDSWATGTDASWRPGYHTLAAHLQQREAQAAKLAEALREFLAAGDAYTDPDADEVGLMVRFGEADAAARTALAEWEGK